MESDGAGPAEPKRTLGSALGRVLPESIVLTSCLETIGGHLVIVGRLSSETYSHGALKTLNTTFAAAATSDLFFFEGTRQ